MPGGATVPSPHVLVPRLAAVTPRAYLDDSDTALPLPDLVRRIVRDGRTRVARLVGPPGAGKSIAMRHLSAVLPPDAGVLLVDGDLPPWPQDDRNAFALVLCCGRESFAMEAGSTLRMAPWCGDDLIEYLLARHRERCASVMARVKAAGAQGELDGSPELWSLALDLMADHDALATPTEALRHVLSAQLGDEGLRWFATEYCATRLLRDERDEFVSPAPPGRGGPDLVRLLGHRAVRVVLAAQRIVWDLAAGGGGEYLRYHFPPDLVREVARLLAFRLPAGRALQSFVDGRDRATHRTAATLQLAADAAWRPSPGSKPTLTGAVLGGAKWAGIDLRNACVSAADLSGADLDGAALDGAAAGAVVLRQARLRAATLKGLRAMHADLHGADLATAGADGACFDCADLSGADLRAASLNKASLRGADLRGAKVSGAELRGADLSGAKLEGACLNGAGLRGATLDSVCLRDVELARADFRRAKLTGCDLQAADLSGAAFNRARFTGSDLTAATLRGADLRRACLRETGLADVDLESADLRRADFTGASFHLGSTRAGLVGSVVPCEGSKTGFYTDEFEEQYYRPPAEIRKANLCNADLRGAKVDGVDFYLVDLRGARYTAHQARHFRRCGAIL